MKNRLYQALFEAFPRYYDVTKWVVDRLACLLGEHILYRGDDTTDGLNLWETHTCACKKVQERYHLAP